MALWALLGAASGFAASATLWLAEAAGINFHISIDLGFHQVELAPATILPGLFFGLAAGLGFWRMRLAQGRQVAVFTALSILAWYAGSYVGGEYGWDWASGLHGSYLGWFVIGVVGGTVWAIVQTLAVVLLSFSRRVRPLATLVAVGAVTAGLLLAARPINWLFFDIWPFIILWTGWYAVYAAVLSLFLPWPKSAARPEEKGAGRASDFPA